MQHGQAQEILRLVRPVRVEGVRDGMRARHHYGLGCRQFLDLGDQGVHRPALDDLTGDAHAHTLEGVQGSGKRFSRRRPFGRRIRSLRHEFTECFGNLQHGEVFKEIDQEVAFCVGRHQDYQLRIAAIHQAFNVLAVFCNQRLFGQDDNGIAHAHSLVPHTRCCTDLPSSCGGGFRRGSATMREAGLCPGKNRCMASSHRPDPAATKTGLSASTKWGIGGLIAGGALGAAVATGSSALAVYFARRVITPVRRRVEDQEILAVTREGHSLQVILAANADTTVEGTYGLFFDAGRGHARIGRIVSYSPAERTVQRDVEQVYAGDLAKAARGYWSGVTYPDPETAGMPCEDVMVDVEGGQAPAWLVRPQEPETAQGSGIGHSAGAGVWAIMVHGRGATRQEALRALTSARRLGLTSLLVSYRNDGLAPSADDGRYGLGTTEWRDVDAAIEYALSNGAREVVLFGWSMGGAICLQTADLSKHRHLIRAMVLDGPVINWVDVLAHHAQLHRIPSLVGRYGQMMLGHPLGKRLTGLAAPVDLKAMDWVSRAVELRTPTLILHSVDDEYVPYGPSAALAERNPEMVTFEMFHRAGHTKEWNVEPGRWEGVVRAWLNAQLAPRTNPGQGQPAG